MLTIADIKVEYETNPVGITKLPRFSWKLISDERNVMQESYKLDVALDENFNQMVASETKEADTSIAIKLSNLTLESLTKYFWRVTVNSTKGEAVSQVGSFTTAYLDNAAWSGKMITAETEDDAADSKSTYVRKNITLAKPVKRAYLLSTAYGLYQAFIDGKKIGEDQLSPGWTSYHKHLLYQVYDVTENLTAGKKHEVGALLGAGFYKGLMGFLHQRNNYGKQTGFLAELNIEYIDGTKEKIVTDTDWEGADGPVIFAEIYDGEIYDARKEIGAHTAFRPVATLDYDKTSLTAQFGCKPRMLEHFSPKAIITTPEGDTVIDFGQNLAGWIQVDIEGAKAGETIELDCFESLDSKGNVYIDNLRGAKNRFIYICKGAPKESYHPHFTYQGFRYAKVVSWAGKKLTADRVTSYAVYSNMEKTGDFSCSNKDINQLWSNITWSLRSNFVDIPTDCPQRNERVGWTGDAQIFCPTANYIMNTFLFFEKWLKDVAFDQTPEGGVPHVVPDIVTPTVGKVQDWLCSQGSHSAAAWADVAVLNPWNIYLAYGDKQILIDQYESMKKWIQFMESHANGIIWNYKLQFGDWVALDAQEGSYFGATPNDLTCTAYYALSTETFANAAEVVGNMEDEKYFHALAAKIREGFAKEFFDSKTKGMKVMTQTAHIIALHFGLTPEEYKEQTIKELVDLLAKENGHLVTGFVGTPYFTHALSENGRLKEAYDLLLKDDFPSWLYQVKQGATTIWEHWDGLKPDGTMWSPDMNSFNHYAYGSIGEWLIRVVAGINTDAAAPGYKHIILYPRIGGGLTEAKGEYESVHGKVLCQWNVNGDKLTLNVEIPANTTASLKLDEIKALVDEDGAGGSLEEGTYQAKLASGRYSMTFKMGE